MKRSPYWYIGSLHILTNTYATALTTKQVARKVLFPPCLIQHIPLSQIKMTYTKKTLEYGKCYRRMDIRKALLVKSLRELLTTSLPELQQQTQAADIQEEEIRMSINLPYAEGTSEKLVYTQIT